MSWFVTVAFYDINGYDLRADAEDADRYIRLIAGANPPPPHDVELWLDKHTFPLDSEFLLSSWSGSLYPAR